MSVKFKNTGIIIQARMGSTRLPSKIMLSVNAHPILLSQLDRLKKSNISLYIATTVKPQDDVIEIFSKEQNIPCFRGDENNVLSRYYECARFYNLDLIVRVTSDCPLIDQEIIKKAVEEYKAIGDSNLYYSNTIQRSYPRGFDFEIFSFQLLESAYTNAFDESDKEHVTPYIWKNKNGNTQIKQLVNAIDNSKFRLTLDTPEDFSLLKILIEDYSADKLSGEEIVQIMRKHPNLSLINEHIEQKKT